MLIQNILVNIGGAGHVKFDAFLHDLLHICVASVLVDIIVSRVCRFDKIIKLGHCIVGCKTHNQVVVCVHAGGSLRSIRIHSDNRI